ncbi:hypothetical protein HII31_10113 [Pseudocercospora fuligena]|uniref:Uncharacterized protein n=1 Tax=Pseudocercospora fuligena TaxID=685502 RepID=A0A8H6RE92_9PEZI|nr:hypothetical protein HII31_10113 [Pseudocercospora fuligena]
MAAMLKAPVRPMPFISPYFALPTNLPFYNTTRTIYKRLTKKPIQSHRDSAPTATTSSQKISTLRTSVKMSAFTILEKKYDHYFPSGQPSLPKAVAGGIRSIEVNYPGSIDKSIILQVLGTVVGWQGSDVSAQLKDKKAEAKNQLEIDLWYGLDEVLQEHGATAKIDEWVWVFKKLVKAVEDDSIDGTEGDEKPQNDKPSAGKEASEQSKG